MPVQGGGDPAVQIISVQLRARTLVRKGENAASKIEGGDLRVLRRAVHPLLHHPHESAHVFRVIGDGGIQMDLRRVGVVKVGVAVVKGRGSGGDGFPGALTADGIRRVQHGGNVPLNGHFARRDSPVQAVHMQPNPKGIVALLALAFQGGFRFLPRHAADGHVIHINPRGKRVPGQDRRFLAKQRVSLVKRNGIKPHQAQGRKSEQRGQRPQHRMPRTPRRAALRPRGRSLRLGGRLVHLIRIWRPAFRNAAKNGLFSALRVAGPQGSGIIMLVLRHRLFLSRS